MGLFEALHTQRAIRRFKSDPVPDEHVRRVLDAAVLPQVRGQPGAIGAVDPGLSACGGGNFMRRLCLPKAVKHWSLRSVQIKLIKIGGRLVRHAGRLVFPLAEVAVPRGVFRQVLERIDGLQPAPG